MEDSALPWGSHEGCCAPPPAPGQTRLCEAHLWPVLHTGSPPLHPPKASFLAAPVVLMGHTGLGLSPPFPGTPTQRASPGTEGPWVPRLHASPRMHTSLSFTWHSRRLAPALMLKIGTQGSLCWGKEGRQASDKGDSKPHRPGKGACAERVAGGAGFCTQSAGHGRKVRGADSHVATKAA